MSPAKTKRTWKKVEANIYRCVEENGLYRVRVTAGRNRNGNPRTSDRLIRGSITSARALRTQLAEELGSSAVGYDMTLDDYFEQRYIPALRKKAGVTESHVRWVEGVYRNQISPAKQNAAATPFGQRQVSRPPSTESVQEAICNRWSAQTAKHAVRIYRQVYRSAKGHRLVSYMPWVDEVFAYRKDDAPKEGGDRRDAWTPEQAVWACRKLEENGSPLTALAAALFGAGMRPEEALGLDKSDVHFATLPEAGLVARIHIYKVATARSKLDNRARGIEADTEQRTKTDTSERWVTICEPFAGILQRALDPLPDDSPICINSRGVRFAPARVSAEWKKYFVHTDTGATRARKIQEKQAFRDRMLEENRREYHRPVAAAREKLAKAREAGDEEAKAEALAEIERLEGVRKALTQKHRVHRNPVKIYDEDGILAELPFAEIRLARHTGMTMLRKARVPFSEIQMYRGHVAGLGVDAVSYFDPTDPELFDGVAEKTFKYLKGGGLM